MPNSSTMTHEEQYMMTMATNLEIVLPPFALIFCILLAVTCLSLHRRCRRQSGHRAMHRVSDVAQNGTTRPTTPSIVKSRNHSFRQEFFTDSDLQTLRQFQMFPNRMGPLIRMCMPAVLSLAFCPLTILSGPILANFFWPPEAYEMRPNVNDAISCFLTPAGLIYAIAFGFAFQQAMEKSKDVLNDLREEMGHLAQMTNIVVGVKNLPRDTKSRILRLLKDAVIQEMTNCTHNEKCLKQRGSLWEITDCLSEVPAAADDVGLLDAHMLDELTSRILSLDSMMYSGGLAKYGKINLLQWLFLEMLGFMAFFGILLVKASSNKLELTMCVLTVFSISLFCYVLADFDDPFHGFFRVDVTLLANSVFHMESCYQQVLRQSSANASLGEVEIQAIATIKDE